jgi:hypothetical protein
MMLSASRSNQVKAAKVLAGTTSRENKTDIRLARADLPARDRRRFDGQSKPTTFNFLRFIITISVA